MQQNNGQLRHAFLKIVVASLFVLEFASMCTFSDSSASGESPLRFDVSLAMSQKKVTELRNILSFDLDILTFVLNADGPCLVWVGAHESLLSETLFIFSVGPPIFELLTNNHTHVFGFPRAFLGTNSYMSI